MLPFSGFWDPWFLALSQQIHRRSNNKAPIAIFIEAYGYER
jgi:hypothetical protein